MDYTPYSSDINQQDSAHHMARRRSPATKIAIFFAIILVCTGAAYWVAQTFPDKMKDLIITVDRFGITDVGALEQKRVRTINRLSITYEEKQVLIQRTVFLSATREMVYLALGDPVCVLQGKGADATPTEHWVYYIQGDRKPTMLSFQNNELVNAGKASALDTCK